MKKIVDERVLAIRLRLLRELSGLTQKQLSEQTGISFYKIQKYEEGIPTPRIDVVLKLAEFYDVSVEFLCGLTDDPYKIDIPSQKNLS